MTDMGGHHLAHCLDENEATCDETSDVFDPEDAADKIAAFDNGTYEHLPAIGYYEALGFDVKRGRDFGAQRFDYLERRDAMAAILLEKHNKIVRVHGNRFWFVKPEDFVDVASRQKAAALGRLRRGANVLENTPVALMDAEERQRHDRIQSRYVDQMLITERVMRQRKFGDR